MHAGAGGPMSSVVTPNGADLSTSGASAGVAAADRPWLNHYPKGVRWDIATDSYRNVLEVLEDTFRSYAGAAAQENLGFSMTYRQLEEQSRQLATFFQAQGL